MADIALPPPAPFLALPGKPPIPWTRWLQSFETFILAVGLTDVSAARKKALLLHCLGAEGQRVLSALESGTTSDYDTAVELLNAHFAAPQSALLRRFLFRQRHQLPGESVQQYVANLRGLASTCKFGALQDEMIHDQLIEHTNDAKVRETLLLEPDDLSLSRAITIAVRIESAAACASALTKQQTIADCPAPCPMPPSTLQPSQNDTLAAADSSTFMLLRRQQRSRPRPQAQTPRPCDNYGSSSHLSRAQNCPARGQTCRNCGKRNHFASVCRSAPAVSVQAPTIIHNVYSGPVSFKACSVRLNDVCIPLLLDTGASVSLLNMHTYNTFFGALPLSAPAASLCGYGDSKIDLVGSLQVSVGYGNKMVPSFTFHVARRRANLMGLGSLTAFAHQPLLNPTIKPVIQPLRRIPLALRDSVSAELKQLLDIGIIEPVDASPWVSNLVVAQKKSGALRVCADLRAVNKAVIPDRFPLPTSEELIAQFHGSTVFSKLDLRQGYLQVPLHPSSRNLTAFVTHAGVFRYTRMPFGLSSAPSCFQKIMVSVLAGIPGVAIYLDDVVIHGPTPESHDERLSKLTLNAEKCIFSAPTIEYVGFQLSADGVTPLRSNIDAILAIPEPSSAAQVASFLGMTGYYLKFLPHYSATTAPLRRLLRKDEPWVWTQACSDAVRALKVQLTTAPVLAHFDISSPTWVTCDASATAIGAVLSQTQRGVEKPIAFASRPSIRRSRDTRTDHQALTALLSTSGTGHRPLRLHRWSDSLRQYNFDLKFTPGRDNVVADLLSRSAPPHPNTPIHTDTDQVERDIVQMLHAPLQAVISLQELKEASEQDPVLSQLRVYILNGWPQEVPEGLAAFSRIKQELSCWNDTCAARGLCTVIPSTLRARVLAMAHEGHLGIVKLKQRCRERVWWPGIDKDIEALVKDCAACFLSGKTGHQAPPPLQPLAWPSQPWDHLQLDICGEIQGVPHHQRFLVVVYDLHSKWPQLIATGSVTSQVIINFLDSLFSRWGLPNTITTDNGPQLISAEFKTYLKNKCIHHIRTAYYHPQANGGVERFHQSLKNSLRAHLFQGWSFSQAIHHTLLHYRATQHSPAFLMLGRELHLPLDRLTPALPQEPLQRVRASVTRQQRRMKQKFDLSARVKVPDIKATDWVRVRRPHRDNKLASYWSAPLQVTHQLGPATFLLSDGTRWHASRLRKVPPLAHTTGVTSQATPTARQDTPALQLTPRIAPAQAPDISTNLPAEICACPSQAAQPHPHVSPRHVRIRSRPGHLQDFVSTFHV
ncbi:hypothetical protein M9458_056604 [Cirrhinus mrigala]|uniref:Gypsy retrotransposon integrase-like protein 1 n=1 Tax=Cirrhinus mrigala TaxID=683832 RepID=A0ABD0MCU6_CIRMR